MVLVSVFGLDGSLLVEAEDFAVADTVADVRERVQESTLAFGAISIILDGAPLHEDMQLGDLAAECGAGELLEFVALVVALGPEDRERYQGELARCAGLCKNFGRPMTRCWCSECWALRTPGQGKATVQERWASFPVEAHFDHSVALAAVRKDARIFEDLSSTLRADKSIASAAVKRYPPLIRFVPEDCANYKGLAKTAVTYDGLLLQHVRAGLCDDKTFVLAALRQNPLAVEYISPSMQPDSQIALALFASKPKTGNNICSLHLELQAAERLRDAPDTWKSNKAFMKMAVKINGLSVKYAGAAVRVDKAMAIDAVRNNPHAVYFLEDKFWTDMDILKWCVEIMEVKPPICPDFFADGRVMLERQVQSTSVCFARER